MNAFQKCSFTGDVVPLYLPQELYLKPIAQITITVHLPKKLVGKVVSNWELMEKLRSLITPDEFTVLTVSNNTIELIKFQAEIEDKTKLSNVIIKLDNKLIKLKDFHSLFKVRATASKLDFPNKHIWDSFFRDAKQMNEMKPGERPDTIHISNLPIRWFVPYHLSGEENMKPSEKIFYRVFEKFGRIRHVDIPVCDPYRSKMKSQLSGLQIFSFDEKELFEGYVQFKDYVGFSKAMDAFRGMKLLHKDHEFNETYMVNIKLDFDKTKHMSEPSIKRREIVRERLIKRQKDKEKREELEKEAIVKKEKAEKQKVLDVKKEKEGRRKTREENRKAKILGRLKVKDADALNAKIVKEEKKLLKAQRKLEAIRLVEELFKRIKYKQENSIINVKENDELSKYKAKFKSRYNNLHHTIAGRVVLKSILSGETKTRRDSSSSDSSLSVDEPEKDNKRAVELPKAYPVMYQYPVQHSFYSPYFGGVYQPATENYLPYQHRGRGGFNAPGPSRGFRRGRGGYNPYYRSHNTHNRHFHYTPELQAEYYKYFQKFFEDHDDRDKRSYTRSRSRSRSSRSRRRSYSRSRRSRSYTRSRRSYSRSQSRSRSRSRSRQKSRRSHRSRTRSSHSQRYKSRTNSPEDRRKSRSPSHKSVDSSKFIAPNRSRKSRSRSWSMPSASNKNKRSWSRTPSPS